MRMSTRRSGGSETLPSGTGRGGRLDSRWPKEQMPPRPGRTAMMEIAGIFLKVCKHNEMHDSLRDTFLRGFSHHISYRVQVCVEHINDSHIIHCNLKTALCGSYM